MKFFKNLSLGHYVAGFFIFATIGLLVSYMSLVAERQSDQQNNPSVDYSSTAISEMQTQVEADKQKLHNLCLEFLKPPLSEGGAVIDVDRIVSCKDYLSVDEYGEVLEYQALRASGKLTVFVNTEPFYIYYSGLKYSSNSYDGNYSVVFDPMGNVSAMQMANADTWVFNTSESIIFVFADN